MPQYFDIHSHLDFAVYDADRDAVIARLKETETHTICIGVDLASSERAVALADQHDNIYACIGIHPVDEPQAEFDEAAFSRLVKHPKVVAIGECGLDFYHADKTMDYERQEKLFLTQINFAVNHDKPLMIHARQAYDELLAILEPLKQIHGEKLRGNIHFFAGTWEQAQRFHALGFTTSFTGVITFASSYDEVIKKAPLSMIMAETDAPFATPVPHRGERNDPVYVKEVVARIAAIRGEDPELVRKALVENALNMVG